MSLLQATRLAISKRQVLRLLTERQDDFIGEARDVLRAGLEGASSISVDDTGAQHKAKNGFCTQIGNDHFTWFGTRTSKSRRNFLDLLRAGHTDFVLNAEAFDYMRERALSATLIARLAEQPETTFADQAAWSSQLDRLGFTGLTITPDPVQIATEGAILGSTKAHGFAGDAVVLSDDAGQFAVGHHALCWAHAERLVHKLNTVSDPQRAAQQRVRQLRRLTALLGISPLRGLIWDFYADLKAYRTQPSVPRRRTLRARFDRTFRLRTGFVTLDRLLARLYANKAELLMVLERPETPLNTNGSENDIRCQVTRRKVSAGTRSDLERDCSDAFFGLAKTCTKLGVAFRDYLGSRLSIPGQQLVPPLPGLVRCRGQPA